MADVIEDAANALGYVARLALQRAHLHWSEIETHIVWCDERIARHTSRPTRRRPKRRA